MDSFLETYQSYVLLCQRLAWTRDKYGQSGSSMGGSEGLLGTLGPALPVLYRQLCAAKDEETYNRIEKRIRAIQKDRDAKVDELRREINEVVDRLIREPYVLEQVKDLRTYEYNLRLQS